MSKNNEQTRQHQEEKIQELRDQGINPFPSEVNRTHTISVLLAEFQSLLEESREVGICGRVKLLRDHGKIMFADIDDGTEKIQTLFTPENGGHDTFQLLKGVLTEGDFLEVHGTPCVTRRGVHSIQVTTWKMLSKALLQAPSDHFGLKAEEQRYRKRYLDMLTNPEVIDLMKKKSVFWNSIREFMLRRDFLEVETPILEPSPIGAKARQFQAHHNALDTDVYLRISTELSQKKLIIGGIPKVFEIGRVFRNEGMSHEHAQDYTAFEFYEAYQDSRGGIPMTIDLIRTVAQKSFGTLDFSVHGNKINLAKEWDRLSFRELIRDRYNFCPLSADLDGVKKVLDAKSIRYKQDINVHDGVSLLWKPLQKDLAGPAIVEDIPYYFAPLGKRSEQDERIVEEFKIIICGVEVGHMFNELNDPIDQRKRLSVQQSGMDTLPVDQLKNADFAEALEYGMPPVFGFGCSERLFSLLADVSIREAQAFPLVKPS